MLEYDHLAGCSITGGFVYRGCALPDIEGTYFYGELYVADRNGEVFKIVPGA